MTGETVPVRLRKVGPVSSVRSSSTERGDRRKTWACRRLCGTPLARGGAGGKGESS